MNKKNLIRNHKLAWIKTVHE